MSKHQQVLLGIGGGIAAYKTPDLVRRLIEQDCEVISVLTNAGSKFVTSHTLAAVSGNRVRDNLWDEEAEQAMGHIELARWADLLLIAPATADLMAKMAQGKASDLLTTLHLACQSPVMVAPAMNQAMWHHPATQRNLTQLREDGVHVVGPEYGSQACGDIGPGRMSEPADIANAVANVLAVTNRLSGVNVLITAGPTREAIDPVRYISNSSSGRQGFALARAARDAGASVTLVSGPVGLETPTGVDRIDVVSSAQMKNAVMSHVSDCDIFFSVAAVSDYRPTVARSTKIKRQTENPEGRFHLELEETDDILKTVASLDRKPFVVGFAAETNNVLEYGREKRKSKGIDAIVINDVSDASIGFDSEENAVTIVHASGEQTLPKQNKLEIARQILSSVASLRNTNTEETAEAD